MKNPIANLGDYGTITKDLKLFNGCKNALYDSIGNTAVAKATPSLLLKGGIIGAGVLAIAYGSFKAIRFMQHRKQLIQNEPVLKNEFIETFKTEQPKESTDEEGEAL
jgi:hypothetical protein